MKKLIMLLAVCAIAIAQAASIDWAVGATKSNKIYGSDGTTIFGKAAGDAAYLILSDYADGIKIALKEGTFSALTEGVVGTASKFTSFGGVSSSTATSALLADCATYDFSVLFVNGDASQYVLTGAQSAMTSDADTLRDAQFTYVDVNSVGWTASNPGGGDVPEPTSGLLLLVGGAALALRRRQE